MILKPIVGEQRTWTDYWMNREMEFDKEYPPTRELFMDERTWFEKYWYLWYAGDIRVAAWEESARGHLQKALAGASL